MQPAAGRSFGPYEILAPIGEGGMGEVFKARDTRLNRIVAIKTSKDQFSDRFTAEARATAALNHPHIATLYDVGPDYLVMEYVEGEHLRGPLPLDRGLHYAREILDALDAAHKKGIVHRDLKPGNILIAKSGVKLLDFGLAAQTKAAVQGGGDATATIAISAPGAISGTLQYMAPEQLQGKPADSRSDIFAFGLVLYEMLTGHVAYEADNPASLITALMSAPAPPLRDRFPSASPALERIYRGCIEKDPDDRWQSAADIRRALDLIDLAPAATASAAAPRTGRLQWWHAALPALAIGAMAGAFALRSTGSSAEESWTFRPLTYSGRVFAPAISPDGKQVVYGWSGEDGKDSSLYLQLVSGGNPLRLPETRILGRPAWSPDSTRIAFQNRDGLYVTPALGGTPRRISALGRQVNTANVAWAPNGAFFIVDGRSNGLMTIPGDGGEPQTLVQSDKAYDAAPAIAPDGSAVAFVRHTSTFNSRVMLMPLTAEGKAAGEPKELTDATSFISMLDWTGDGKAVLFESAQGGGNPSIWRVSSKGGKPVRVNLPSMIARQPTLSRQTGRMVFVTGHFEAKLVKMPLTGANPARAALPIVEALGDHRDLAVSADGARIAFVSTRTGSKEIWVANTDGSKQTQLTFFENASVGSPRWSPDGSKLAFDGYASGSSDIYVIPADGGKPVRLTVDAANEVRPSWSPDGKWIYFGWNRNGPDQIWKLPAGGGDPVQVTRTGGHAAFETPDGQWLYVLDPPKLYRMRPDGSGMVTISEQVTPNMFGFGGHHIHMLDPRIQHLLRAPFGSDRLETVATFDDSNRPSCIGACVGIPADESFVVYRRATRDLTSLTLIDNFR